jgi:hypothetical protein
MNTKVRILTRCDVCRGEAYLSKSEETSFTGEQYTRYEACRNCDGSGKAPKWIDLAELANLLDEVTSIPLQPDWQELAQEEPTSQYRDSREAAGI